MGQIFSFLNRDDARKDAPARSDSLVSPRVSVPWSHEDPPTSTWAEDSEAAIMEQIAASNVAWLNRPLSYSPSFSSSDLLPIWDLDSVSSPEPEPEP